MGWTDLIKRKASELGLASKQSKLKPDPRLRWFGKLPTYADYYTSTADEAWAQEFNDWILQGYDIYHRRLQSAAQDDGVPEPERGRPNPVGGECVIRLPKSGMTVLASIQDYGGDMRGRKFPLCFYVGLPTEQWPGPTSDRLSAIGRAVRDLMSLRRQVIRFCNSPGNFEAVFGQREIDLEGIDLETRDDAWMKDARDITLADWFAQAGTVLKAEQQGEWCQLAIQFGRSISENDSDSFEPTLRFPLARGLHFDAQLAGWIHWLERRMKLQHRILSLMVTGVPSAEGGHLIVIARQLVPEDFLLVTSLAGSLSYVDDLCRLRNDPNREGGTGPDDADFDRWSGDSRWSDFVDAAT